MKMWLLQRRKEGEKWHLRGIVALELTVVRKKPLLCDFNIEWSQVDTKIKNTWE